MTGDYPRPQLVRTEFTCLDGPWGFAIDEHDQGIRERWFDTTAPYTRSIQVPYPPEAPASGIGENVDGVLWYRREFSYQQPTDDRVLLHFEGVDYRASVWLNGIHVGDHEGSQTRFTFDVTEAIGTGSNSLVVRAVDEVDDLEQPRGKQDWQPEPHIIWYKRSSGIWRSVWLEPVPATRIDRLNLQPQADLKSIRLEARIAGRPSTDVSLEVEFRLGDRLLAQVTYRCTSGVIYGVIVLDHASLDVQPEELVWTPESPTLISVRARLLRNATAIDTVASYVGLRSVAVDESRFVLNGRPYFLRLVLEQGYWPESHLASPSFAALEQEAGLIKALGFNGIRMHQTSADPRFLACCDRLGLVVLADAAAAYRFSDVALVRTTAEVTALVQQDGNHPSIIGWVPFNESWGVPDLPGSARQRHAVRAAYELIKALDPTRLVLGNDGWEYVAGDFLGIHDYTQDALVLHDRYGSIEAVRRTIAAARPGGRAVVLPGGEDRAAKIPVLLSEFGGISVHDDPNAWDAYGDVARPDDLAAQITALVAEIGDDSGLAGYCYTQLTDTAQEKNGLLDDRRRPKCPPELIRAALLGLSERKA
jgi:beta-galactosidase/beta-glucuronidase